MQRMAVYHFSAKTVSRSAGRSSTAAAAYRAGERIVDERTGEIHDYTRKGGVVDSLVVLPHGGTMDRAELWNKVEAHHKRGDATVAREFVVALPAELDAAQRQELARTYARELADRYGVGVDLNVHAPGKDGDQRNHHAHILLTSCYCGPTGTLGKKAVELDPIHCQRQKLPNVVEVERERWEQHANRALEKAGKEARIDHRSLAEQGIYDRAPTVHLGPDATAIKRRGGVSTIEERAKEQAAEFMADMQAQAALLRAAERDVAELEALIAAAEWEARPVSERLAEVRQEQERLLQVRRDLWARKQVADEAAKKAKPQAEVEKAIEALPGALKAAGKAKARVQELEAQEGGLGWWQWVERRRLRAELPKAQAEAVAKVQGAVKLNELAKAPVLEKVQAEQQAVASGLQKFDQDYDPVVHQVVELEAQQKALEAQQAAIEAQRQAKALAEANKAVSERIKAQVAQRQAERAAPKVKERDQGPTLGM
jgi:hypothetical protein